MEKKRVELKLHLHTAMFTMLIALLVLCFQQAHVVVSFAEQWRARIFILLNLLLLSVLFTSLHFTRSNDEHEEYVSCRDRKESMRKGEKIAGKKRRRSSFMHEVKTSSGGCSSSSSSNAEECCEFSCNMKAFRDNAVIKDKVCCKEVEEDVELMSEEELNRRVEAFIAMFRQHLISDSKRKSRFVAHTLN